MNTSRKIQIALGTIFLWSSTSVSSFAATNTITPGKVQSNTIEFSVESIPSKQLNLTQDAYLIAQSGDQIYRIARQIDVNNYIPQFEDALKKPDSKQILLAFCPSQSQDKVEDCWKVLKIWVMAKEMQVLDSRNWDLADKIGDVRGAVMDAVRQRK